MKSQRMVVRGVNAIWLAALCCLMLGCGAGVRSVEFDMGAQTPVPDDSGTVNVDRGGSSTVAFDCREQVGAPTGLQWVSVEYQGRGEFTYEYACAPIPPECAQDCEGEE